MNKVIIICGPTCSGKTDLSLKIAKKHQLPIVNFDSLLFYKELNIGTAKPTLEERGDIPHHMIDICPVKNHINAADYCRQALPIVKSLLEKTPIILVGGSGFYLQALLKGMYDSPTTPLEILEKSETLYEEYGITPFLEILEKEDPPNFEKLHTNDHYRIRRAVEHFWTTGTPFSKAKETIEQQQSNIHGWELLRIYLDLPKELHWEYIQKRTKTMLDDGLLEEVTSVLDAGHTGQEKPLLSIGYKEAQEYLQGELSDLEELEERISISTRQLAKAQRTWFKKQDFELTGSPLEDDTTMLDQVHQFLRS